MSNKRLLIIEDDMDIAELLIIFFDKQGYDVFHADMGKDGIALARAKFPNLILLDVMLPDMVGFDICQVLRTTNLTKYIPILFLTQRDARADRVAGLQLGADDYITKPFDIEELRLRVQASIRRATRDHLHEVRTGLPSGPLIQDEFERLRDQAGWHYLNIELAGLTAFRSHYGFLAGDEAISLAATIIREAIIAQGTPDDFVGSIESRFVLFSHTSKIDELMQYLAKTYKERAQALYNFKDIERGYLIINEDTKAPLLHFEITAYGPDQVNSI